jgi:hypothetical protein
LEVGPSGLEILINFLIRFDEVCYETYVINRSGFTTPHRIIGVFLRIVIYVWFFVGYFGIIMIPYEMPKLWCIVVNILCDEP